MLHHKLSFQFETAGNIRFLEKSLRRIDRLFIDMQVNFHPLKVLVVAGENDRILKEGYQRAWLRGYLMIDKKKGTTEQSELVPISAENWLVLVAYCSFTMNAVHLKHSFVAEILEDIQKSAISIQQILHEFSLNKIILSKLLVLFSFGMLFLLDGFSNLSFTVLLNAPQWRSPELTFVVNPGERILNLNDVRVCADDPRRKDLSKDLPNFFFY